MLYDAIVIGAGHNGLVAAIHLAKAGWRVLVLERNRVAGGAVQTREATLPGFQHDICATNLSLFAGSPFVRQFGTDLARHGLEFVTADDIERENPNLVDGCSLGGSMHLRQNFFLRPFAGWSRYRMPIRNLYMVGAATWPGAGTGAGSGHLLVRMLS